MNPSRFCYTNARRPQTGERRMGFIGLGRLRDWARLENDPSQLIAWMLSNIPELETFLNSGSITNYSLKLLMVSLKSVLQVSNYDQSLTKLLTILATTRFYDHMITFLSRNRNINGKGEAETCLHFIIETIRKAPTLTENCLEILTFIDNNYQKLRCDVELLQNALEMFTTSGQIKAKKERRHLRKWRDNDEPPDDIRDVSIFPTSRDLNTDFTPFLRANKTTGAYRDVDQYFDVMFRLMREDFIQPLREGIGKYRINGAAPEDSDMLFYENVKIIGLEVFNGIDHILMLDMSKLQKVRWDSDRRLIFGSLICLTNNNFKTIIYATVTQMDRSEIKKGILRVRFQNCLEDVYGFSSEEALTLTENPSFFEAYRHVLEGLQEMVEKRLPMEQYLVRCEKEIDAPAYLKRQTQYNLSCIVKTRRILSTVQVIKTENWPGLAYVCLNKHQYMAVKAALTKELTLLQGPPGTGKTYVGLKVMRSLLENLANTSAAGSPILVVCYANHALDQFLEEMLTFCGDGIVRVGGKNDSVKLKQFNLKELRSKQRDSRSTINCIRDCHREMDEIGKKINALADKIQISHLSIISEKSLQRCMSLRHFRQFNQTSSKSIRHWLCASELQLENHIELVVEAHLVKLFLSETTSFNDTHLNFRYIIPVEQKMKVYRFWLKRYEKKTGILNSTSLISERELHEYVNPEVYQKIIKHYGNLKAWLLGSNVNEMVAAIEEIQHNWQQNQQQIQLFDDSEEYNRIREQRQFDDESDDEDNRKQAPRSRLVRSQTSLLQKCHLLGIDITSDVTKEVSHREAWQEVQKKLTFSQVIRLLRVSKPMTTKEENSVVNIWTLSLSEKYRLYKCWLLKYHSSLNDELKALVEEYESVLKIKLEQREMQDVNILKQSKVIGMTTTGAAKHRQVLQKVGPKIVVVEEAAEVLEAHIVTALSEHCQHLILIGDHQQLRPKTEVYQLAKKFGLEISLFERLVKNNISCVQLTGQHRMRPEISKYMKHIYPALKDSSSVYGRDHVMGMHKDIFFINHDRHEGVVQNSRSKLNEYEAKYLLKLALYLVIQGYSAGEITILATYGGQINLIKECLASMGTHRLQGIRVSTVDNFQGEQNKIILLSLVRSNTQGSVGFLSTDNRICVALSRAQYGMYVIGNIDLLSQHSALWSKIKATAQSHSEIGQVLRLCCKHHQRVTLIKDTSDFDLLKAGGCGEACKLPLSCGHICPYLCHAVSHDTLHCKKPCEKKCPNRHACKGVCSKQCPPCSTEIEVKLKCNHILKVKCSLYSSASSYSCVEECQKFCLKGHKCKGKCSQSCPPCLEKLNCGHVCSNVPCYSVKPTYILGCDEKCQNGHKCPALCQAVCPTSCDNTLRLCGHICGTKFNIVSSQHLLPTRFRKQTCSHKCPKLCAGGRHPCSGQCSEPCPPCQSVVRYRLLTCGHIGVLECHKNPDTHKWHCKECHAKKLTFPCGHSIEVSEPPVKQCPYCLLDEKFTKLQI
ncbi:NFX1-type zinc finger-containing protein 1 [Biomphalaria pfeifferi]|uniref:NFX1-type zinc finger-containing protein 1 n=1 Tax=Biomphalaria pfeifferi TaxID=112525 RepID=A0AAD8F637_BIOPF|nr:NFX1-type zinc finger-containing protein 1 [Biomphalaria pfeifferi]